MHLSKLLFVALAGSRHILAQNAADQKLKQLDGITVDTNGQVETTDTGVQDNTSNSLRAGPRGYVLLEDTTVRKKMIHFDRERVPERVVHALGHGAYGTFRSYGDWSNLTSACWLKNGTTSEAFTRFSVVVASTGGSESGRDTHGFATKIYSQCGNQDLVGNHLSSFFIQDGADFPDLIHSVKYEANKGFPTGGTAHPTAYDFFTQHPEGAFQLMNVLSDLGIPRDVRHISGNGVHTFRFVNDKRESQLFKWYWLPVLGHRALVYDEATKIAGKNNNFQRVDLYNSIDAGIYPEWELAVQLFPDDGTYMWKGIDLLQAPQIIPFEMNQPVKLGKLTLNRNPTNFFAEPESISFAPSNVVKGVSFVPDPLLQWRLMSYDDTSTHRHGSPNGYLLPINKAIAPISNNYRDGYMQPLIFEGDSTSAPNSIGGIQEASSQQSLPYTGSQGETAGIGNIGRYVPSYDWAAQARNFWGTLDKYAQQHAVDAYRFELGNVGDDTVVKKYIANILNKIDNCLARRVAYGIGAELPAVGSGPMTNVTNSTAPYPSLYPLTQGLESNKSNEGLVVGIVASDNILSTADLSAMSSLLSAQKVRYEVVAPRQGPLASGVSAKQSYITTSSIFYDAIFIGSLSGSNSSASNGTMPSSPAFVPEEFIREAYSHGKAIAAVGSGSQVLDMITISADATMGVFQGDAATVTSQVLKALSGPVRFPWRFPVDSPSICR